MDSLYNPQGLRDLENRLADDLSFINYPSENWLPSQPDLLDVAIIGAGMAGLAASFQLLKLGIRNIRVFDINQHGKEGPWVTYARMKTLRSTKELTGPAFDFSTLTFHAWYKSQYGQKGWEELGKIPNAVWMDYLKWFEEILHLPVEHGTRLRLITPEGRNIKLEFEDKNGPKTKYVRKLVLATGRDGFGGVKIPEFVKNLQKTNYAHSIEQIDFSKLKGKDIAVVGVGASGFDAAAVALETGARSAELLMRRQQLPNVNKFAHTIYPGFSLGYYHLSDEIRLKFLHEAMDRGAPPPHEALDRIRKFSNFHLHSGIQITSMAMVGERVRVETSQFTKEYDFILLGTGFLIDGSKQLELKRIFDKILLWKNRVGINAELVQGYGNFPYLGPHFEFIGKDVESSSYLKNIYCYNYAATASHALLSSDIPGIGYGRQNAWRGVLPKTFLFHTVIIFLKTCITGMWKNLAYPLFKTYDNR